MKRNTPRSFQLLFSLLVLVGLVAPAFSQAHVELPLDLTGVLNKAEYVIKVPANWNGVLLVYCHGYTPVLNSATASPDSTTTDSLLSVGYALVGSSYRNAGWAVKEGIQNTLALTNYFKGHVGNPYRTIIWGNSMGTVIALKCIEKYPHIYDGAIPCCTVGSGSPKVVDSLLAFCLAYQKTFGWPAVWGEIGDLKDDLAFPSEVLPILFSQFPNAANFGNWEFIRLVNQFPYEGFYPFSWIDVMFFATQARAELESRAKGPIAQNLDHIYSLTPDQIGYLNSLGVDAEMLLTQMNADTTINARRPARKYTEKYAEYSGNLTRPVLTMHAINDPITPAAHESAYKETVKSAGREDLLLQVFTDSNVHCGFTPDQYMAVVLAMNFWLETGIKPDASFFPPGFGFVPGFSPFPWPYK